MAGRNVAVCGACHLKRWTGIADRTRAPRLVHSFAARMMAWERLRNRREANGKGKPNVADTEAPKKLEPRKTVEPAERRLEFHGHPAAPFTSSE